MQEASYTLRLSKHQSLPKTGLTPAELILLHVCHAANVGEDPVVNINVTGDAEIKNEKGEKRSRTAAEELRRLRSKYGHLRNKKGDNLLKLLWPGMDVKLPETFDEVKTNQLQYDGIDIGVTDFGTSGGAAVNP